MRAQEKMQAIRTFIEEHIDENLTAKQLADLAGYSLFHFSRLFALHIGTSVERYQRYRRLDHISEEILRGDDIKTSAMRHGFSVSAFYRAFRNRFGITPSEYRSTRGGLALLQPEIIQMDSFRVVGYHLEPPDTDFDLMDAAAYWSGNDFSGVAPEDYDRLNRADLGEIGMWTDPSPQTGEFCYVFGPIVEDFSFVPPGMVTVEVPAARYAVFPVAKAVSYDALRNNVRRLWRYIYQEWLENSDEEYNEDKCSFEFYHGTKSWIYIPLK